MDEFEYDRLEQLKKEEKRRRNPLRLVALERIRVGEGCPAFPDDERWKAVRAELLGLGKSRCAWPEGLSTKQGVTLLSILRKALPEIVWPGNSHGVYSVADVVTNGQGAAYALVEWMSDSQPSFGQGGSGGHDEYCRALVPIANDQADRIVLAWNDAVETIGRQVATDRTKEERRARMGALLLKKRLDGTNVDERQQAALRRAKLDHVSVHAARTKVLSDAGFAEDEVAAFISHTNGNFVKDY